VGRSTGEQPQRGGIRSTGEQQQRGGGGERSGGREGWARRKGATGKTKEEEIIGKRRAITVQVESVYKAEERSKKTVMI
jgi:hypothetical protein